MINARRTGRTAAACREVRREDERFKSSLEHPRVRTLLNRRTLTGKLKKTEPGDTLVSHFNGVPRKGGCLSASEDGPRFPRTAAPSRRLQPAVQLQTGYPARGKTKGLRRLLCCWFLGDFEVNGNKCVSTIRPPCCLASYLCNCSLLISMR